MYPTQLIGSMFGFNDTNSLKSTDMRANFADLYLIRVSTAAVS